MGCASSVPVAEGSRLEETDEKKNNNVRESCKACFCDFG